MLKLKFKRENRKTLRTFLIKELLLVKEVLATDKKVYYIIDNNFRYFNFISNHNKCRHNSFNFQL